MLASRASSAQVIHTSCEVAMMFRPSKNTLSRRCYGLRVNRSGPEEEKPSRCPELFFQLIVTIPQIAGNPPSCARGMPRTDRSSPAGAGIPCAVVSRCRVIATVSPRSTSFRSSAKRALALAACKVRIARSNRSIQLAEFL